MNNSRCTPRRFCARITSLESTSRILSWRQRPRCLPCMSILPKPEKEEGDKEARWVFYAVKPTGGVYRTPVTYPRPYIPEKPGNGSRISRVNRPSPPQSRLPTSRLLTSGSSLIKGKAWPVI